MAVTARLFEACGFLCGEMYVLYTEHFCLNIYESVSCTIFALHAAI